MLEMMDGKWVWRRGSKLYICTNVNYGQVGCKKSNEQNGGANKNESADEKSKR